jgi:trafficking protein particle complex subunit 9
MAQDPLAPLAPAKVRALVLPLGQIKRARFASFLDRLNAENVVHLRDISVDGRPNRSTLPLNRSPSLHTTQKLEDSKKLTC